jgi:hypothetical protein
MHIIRASDRPPAEKTRQTAETDKGSANTAGRLEVQKTATLNWQSCAAYCKTCTTYMQNPLLACIQKHRLRAAVLHRSRVLLLVA